MPYQPRYEFNIPAHHPIDLDHDLLGHVHIAEAICEFLANSTIQNMGLTIGVFGDWGTGKSSVLFMVEELLCSKSSNFFGGALKNIRKYVLWTFKGKINRAKSLLYKFRKQKTYYPLVIVFDAWKYGKRDDVWVGLIKSIMLKLDKTLGVLKILRIKFKLLKRRTHWRKLFLRATVLLVRIFVGFLIFTLGLFLVSNLFSRIDELNTFFEWIQTALGLSTITAALWVLTITIVEMAVKGFRFVITANIDLPSDLIRKTTNIETTFSIDTFHQDLTHIICSIKRPILVLIDDLDRCPSDQIVPVLEAIKHFDSFTRKNIKPNFEYAPISFVLAVDRRAIECAVRTHFKDYRSDMSDNEQEVFAREYIEKIIQVPFYLPPLSQDAIGKLLNKIEHI